MAETGQKMTISIAMATYNGARFLQAQLDSFSAQTRLPDELVVCDDGSKDATLEILETFAASAPFAVRVIRNPENLGFKRNFEKAISLCEGDIIFISDQDDVWLSSKLQVVEQVFRDDPRVMTTINDMIITDAELNHSNKTLLGAIRVSGSNENRLVAGCAAAVRRSFLPVVLPIPSEYLGHDGWISDLSVSLGVRKLIDQPLQLYRRHGANESQWVFYDPNGITLLSVLAETGFSSPLESWERSLVRIRAQKDRVIASHDCLDELELSDASDFARKYLEAEQDRFSTRIHLLSLPRWRRWVSVIGFWARGGYRRFAGWKSAVKDMIRP
ncbi:MAG: glycosyltransferase family 2 protein [Paracoccaceae bacterium]